MHAERTFSRRLFVVCRDYVVVVDDCFSADHRRKGPRIIAGDPAHWYANNNADYCRKRRLNSDNIRCSDYYYCITIKWRRGAVGIECRTCDQEVVGSSLGQARGVKLWTSFSHHVPLFTKQYKLLVPA